MIPRLTSSLLGILRLPVCCALVFSAACDSGTEAKPDTEAPSVSINNPAAVTTATATLQGTATDTKGISRLTYSLNGGAEQEISITPGTSVAFSVEVTLTLGNNSGSVNAYDAAGNRTPTAFTIFYNAIPVSQNDTAATGWNVPVTVSVLANDTDANGTALQIETVGTAKEGTVTKNAGNTVTYVSHTGFTGTDTFEYVSVDPQGAKDTAQVEITINPARYTVTVVSQAPEGAAYAINLGGDAAGLSQGAPFGAFAYINGQSSMIRPTAADVWAMGINDAGKIVGHVRDSTQTTTQAYVLVNGQMTLLPTLGRLTTAYDVNNRDVSVGRSTPTTGGSRVVKWEGTQITDLGFAGMARAISDAGHIVGIKSLTGAFLWKDGQLSELPGLGGTFSIAYGVNDAGWAVGDAETADGVIHPVLWRNNQITRLATGTGSNSTARGVNNHGQVVGILDTTPPGSTQRQVHAFLWHRGTAYNLNTLLTTSGWNAVWGLAINERGEIAGRATDASGANRAVILKPTWP